MGYEEILFALLSRRYKSATSCRSFDLGIILCAEKDHLEVEMALQDVNKPIGIAEYQYLLPQNKLQELIVNELKTNKKQNEKQIIV